MRKKIGLALGSGGARGICHIGILKVLHQHKIYPDFIAGTSVGAVVGATYAAGRTPEEIEELFKKTDWKHIVDFTIPKEGLLRGKRAEQRLRTLVFNKKFKQLDIPLRIVAYNLSTQEKVILQEGNVARALRASISIPGIFTPVRVGRHTYIDGGVVDPTPFDVVKAMGADIVIAVDLYTKTKAVKGPEVKEKSLLGEWRQQFVISELLQVKKLLFPENWPKYLRTLLIWLFDKLLYPARVLRIAAGREPPMITKVMYETFNALTNNLAWERLQRADVDVKITPIFDGLDWLDFDKQERFVKIGEAAMEKEMPKLRKMLGLKH
ncbi:patatin-like phospholipase family protein [Candidatus Woesearchaeota archaeon]|nr:patatin-like phospholipase family protein [Candidatus Woesearchaeota archaeon]